MGMRFSTVKSTMSSTPVESGSSLGAPIVSPQMIGYKIFMDAAHNFSGHDEIGSGQFGQVYKEHVATGEVVAMKLLYQMARFDDKDFLHKCTKLMSANHKNLARFLGYSYAEKEELGQYNGRAIRGVSIRRLIAFQYVQGGNLANFIDDQLPGLNWDMHFKIIKGICEGLQHLHEAGITHFDLTPSNIFVDDKNEPKIADFGISQAFREIILSKFPILTKKFIAKNEYLSPEFLWTGEMSNVSDIFSMGAIIRRIMVGTMHYSSIRRMDGHEFVEHVQKYWRERLQETRRYPSFEADCEQVRTCIEIAVACASYDKSERPLMNDVVRKLYEVETRGDASSRIEQGIQDYQVRKMSFKELEHITSNFSEKLGHDHFGVVYKGKLENGKLIAVKRLNETLRKPEQQFERLVNLMSVEHKNVVKLTGYCYEQTKVPVPDDKNPEVYIWQDVIENVICYEFLPNGYLGTILNDKSYTSDWQTRHAIIHGICEGLHHLHVECQDAPIVHYSVNSNNILVDDAMVPKLGNFCTSMGVTPRGYIAPELMETGIVTVKSNIYSLGLLIIEIATGDMCPNDESSGRSYIENTLKIRMQGFNVQLKYPSLEDGLVQQVDCWINIGLQCVDIQPEKRPTIGQIVHFLQTESADPEYYNYGKFNLSFESGITSSTEMGDHANELVALESMLSDTSVEPINLSYPLLKSVTRNFSRMIGHGGFGAVYLGRLPKGKVAVKKLSILQDLSNTAFVDEIKCLKKAKHSNIVRLLGYCAVAHGELVEMNGTHVILEETQRLLCFEYVPNGDLHDYIKEKCRGDEWKIRYNIIKGVCNGLHYLHKQRISHLDLKCENVLLDANMEPKITDFGLSRFLDEGQSIIVTKHVFGTLGMIQ